MAGVRRLRSQPSLSLASLAAMAMLSGETRAFAQEDCPWREPKRPRSFVAEHGSVTFRGDADPYWFRCAKKLGGELTLRVFAGQGGNLTLLTTRPIRSYSIHEQIGHRHLCEQDPPATHVQVTLT